MADRQLPRRRASRSAKSAPTCRPATTGSCPKLAGGPVPGLPRVFGLAWAFVAHTDSLFDPEVLRRYVRAYQEVQPLTIGELWAVAITLRIVLVENLRRHRRAGRRQPRRAARGRRARRPAAGRRRAAPRAAGSRARRARPRRRSRKPSSSSWCSGCATRIPASPRRWPGSTSAWRATGMTADGVVRDEHQRQVAGSVTVRNIITSMRLISDVDWSELVERFSLVDDLLVAGSRFGEMDFPTRNLYRSAIEELARGSGRDRAGDRPRRAPAAAAAGRAQADGRRPPVRSRLLPDRRRAGPASSAAIGFRPPLRALPGRLYRALGIGGYVGAGALLAAADPRHRRWSSCAPGLAWPWLVVPWRAGRRPRGRPRRRAGQPRGDARLSRQPAAGARAEGRRSALRCARWSSCRRC